MRYWFNESRNELFALAEPPPDLKGTYEVSMEDYAAYIAEIHKADESTPIFTEPVIVDPPAEPLVTTDMERLARVWRKMQEKRDELRHEYEAEDKKIEVQQDQISAALNDAMAKMKATSLRTAAGTVERRPKMQVSAADWEAIYRFIQDNDAWGLLQKRLGSKFVEDWAKSHDGELPPGVNVFTKFVVSVKKPGAKDVPSDGEN